MEFPLRMLLENVIDYAGLFPPAKLEMEPALKEYLSHLKSEEGWIADHFVCTASRLEELAIAIEKIEPDEAFGISAIGSGGIDEELLKRNLEGDFKLIESFHKRVGDAFPVDAFEVRPGTYVSTSIKLLQPYDDLSVFLEVDWNNEQELFDGLHAIVETDHISAKLRTGGLEASAFPAPSVLAGFIHECLAIDLSFKFTAGLHHPIRRADQATGSKMHGFLNLLIGTAIADENELSRAELATIVEDEDPKSFSYNADVVSWQDLEANWETVEEIRCLFLGFGSCSIAEPIEDLKGMGLWMAG